MLLQGSFQLIPASVDDAKIIIGQFTPLRLGLALELFPVTFNTIPVHDILLAYLLVHLNGSGGRRFQSMSSEGRGWVWRVRPLRPGSDWRGGRGTTTRWGVAALGSRKGEFEPAPQDPKEGRSFT